MHLYRFYVLKNICIIYDTDGTRLNIAPALVRFDSRSLFRREVSEGCKRQKQKILLKYNIFFTV